MKKFRSQIIVFVGVYAGMIASLWGITEAYTYFTGEKLKEFLGASWAFVFYGAPLFVALIVTIGNRPSELSWEELSKFTNESMDPSPLGVVINHYQNTDISDSELRRRIIKRNKSGDPTYKLRAEYDRRLRQRGIK